MKKNILFFTEFLKNFKRTGAFCATSNTASRTLSNVIKEIKKKDKKILEVGSGTGAITKEIIKNISSFDNLDLCEMNEVFARDLEKNFSADNIHVFQMPIQNLPEKKYDVIICSLPFLNFDRNLVEEIFDKFKRLSNENTIITFFEYKYCRYFGSFLSDRIKNVNNFLKNFFSTRTIKNKSIWRNIPPMTIHTFKL